MPGWLSWLERTAHRVIKQCSSLFLGYREIAGSNPAPGIQISQEFSILITFFKMYFSNHHNNFITSFTKLIMLSYWGFENDI